MKIKVAVSQYTVPDSAEPAYQKALSVASQASKQKVKLLVLPETALGVLADARKLSLSYFEDIQNIAKQTKVGIATSFYQKDKDSQLYNTGVVVDENGLIVLTYRKIYLAPPEREVERLSHGDKLEVVSTNFGNVGMLICKDSFNKYSHFLYSRLGQMSADIIVIPTWSLGGFKIKNEAYIKSFLTYGAFLSRSFVLASGNLNKRTHSFGQAMIIDPIDGAVRIGSCDSEELIVETIDLAKVKQARQFDEKWQPSNQIM